MERFFFKHFLKLIEEKKMRMCLSAIILVQIGLALPMILRTMLFQKKDKYKEYLIKRYVVMKFLCKRY